MEPTVGILGLGHLGSTLARLVLCHHSPGGPVVPHRTLRFQLQPPVVPFDWTQTLSWEVPLQCNRQRSS